MCGIAGTFNWGSEETLDRMTDSLTHRGPDDRGQRYFPEERAGLGHRRLSILDLSPAGRQPMSNADGRIWIVFNGEIYNFRELRCELEAKGHAFRSRTDTEVLLHLYEEEGRDCFRRLNGMFACAILDRRVGKLVLARDHFGIKPLYTHQARGRLVFGSEIKAILASGAYSPEINRQGLYDYFTYLYVPCPQTMFRDIFQVPPAHVMECDLRTGETRLSAYWELGEGSARWDGVGVGPRTAHRAPRTASVASELRALLTDSVRRQMVSDVPLGVLLSGGVDSPILTGLMAQASSRPVKTFTIVFQGKEFQFYNEQDTARAVAQQYGTEHHEISVDIANPAEMLDLVTSFDQPFGNPTAYLMYLISKHTRREVTVALCGAGGDELFAGYPRYRAATIARRLPRVAYPLLGAAGRALGLLTDNYRTMTLRRLREFCSGLQGDAARQFVSWTYFFSEEQKRRLLNGCRVSGVGCRVGTDGTDRSDPDTRHPTPDTREFLPADRIVRRYLEESPLADFGNRMLHLDLRTFLVDNILEYTDKMSMAVGLEVRVPFLDHRLVEYSLQIPFAAKLRGGESKRILKEACRDLVPDASRRGPKRGFNAPIAIWMRDRLDRYFDETMTRRDVERHGILNWEYIQILRAQHRAGKRDNSFELFAILMFDVWYRRYLLETPVAVG